MVLLMQRLNPLVLLDGMNFVKALVLLGLLLGTELGKTKRKLASMPQLGITFPMGPYTKRG